jgi:hypothetical protein
MNLSKGSSAVLLILSTVLLGHAQTTTGSILGDVTDSAGAVLTSAHVRVTNPSTGSIRETLTNNAGFYQFSGLPPAEYVVSVEFTGFRSVTHSGVILPIQGKIKVDFRM